MLRFAFIFAVMCSLLSQIPWVLDSHLDGYLKLAWGLPCVCLFFYRFESFLHPKLGLYYACSLGFLLYCVVMHLLCEAPYFGADANNVFISLVIVTTSFVFWRECSDQRTMNALCVWAMVGVVVLIFMVYFRDLQNYDITSKIFIFKRKNALAPILLSAAVFILLNYRSRFGFMKYVAYAVVVLAVVFLFVLRSRATLAGLFFILAYFIFKSPNKTLKWTTSIICALAVIYVLLDPEAYNVVVNGILFGGRNAEDLNDLSSGRVMLIDDVLALIPDNLLFGVGNMYMDCMPIIMLAQYGLCGALIIAVYIGCMTRQVASLDRERSLHLTTFLLLMAFLINSLFEAQTPFGPGVKTMILWMFIGFSLAEQTWEETENTDGELSIETEEEPFETLKPKTLA